MVYSKDKKDGGKNSQAFLRDVFSGFVFFKLLKLRFLIATYYARVFVTKKKRRKLEIY